MAARGLEQLSVVASLAIVRPLAEPTTPTELVIFISPLGRWRSHWNRAWRRTFNSGSGSIVRKQSKPQDSSEVLRQAHSQVVRAVDCIIVRVASGRLPRPENSSALPRPRGTLFG